MTARHLPPLAEVVDAALREAARTGAWDGGAGEESLRSAVRIVCEALSAHRPRLLADPGRVKAGYALRDRDERVRSLRGLVPVEHLARRFGVSTRQVYRIMREENAGDGDAA